MAGSSSISSLKSEGLAQESSINDALELDNTPEARFECPICLAWLRDPVVTSCGHRFCRSCIQSWLERENACPVDNMKLEKDNIYPDNFTRREISQQRTKCPNIVRGCLVELSPLDVESHVLECKFRPPEYHLPDNEKLRCSFVDVGCEEKFEDEPEMQRHLEQDIHRHLMFLSRAYKKFSINNQATMSTSAIAQQANFWDPPSKSDSAAISSSSESVENLLKALYEKIVVLEQKNREQEIIISNMSDQVSALSNLSQRYCNGCYIWYITEFKSKINLMRNNHHIMHYSPGFYTSSNGYKLCIRFNLSPRDSNYAAILIHMMKTDHDNTLDWPFSGRITVSIIHPTQSFRNIKETMMTRPELDAFKRPVLDLNPKGFGYTEFVLLEELLENSFTENNQLIVKVVVQPV